MFFKGLLGYLPANLLQGIVGFASLMVFTRLMSPGDFGRYALAFGATSLVYTLTFTWLEAAMARFYPAERLANPEAPALYGSLYRLFLGIGLAFLGAVGAGLVLWPTAGAGGAALKAAIGFGLVGIVPRSLLRLVQEQRRSEGRVAAAACVDMLQAGGGFALAVLFCFGGLKSAAPLAGAGAMALLILPFVAGEDLSRAVRGRFETDAARAYLRYGYPICLSLVLSLALYTVDRFMIAHYLSAADAGAYHAGFSIASRVLDVLFIWFGAAGGPALNQAVESGGEGAVREEARRLLTLMALVVFPAACGLVALAGPLSTVLIGGPLRAPATAIAPLVTLGAVLAGLDTYYFLLPFTLAKRTGRLMLAMGAPALANIGLNLVLIPRFGLVGAAGAYALSFLVGIAAAWSLGRSVQRLPVPLAELSKIAAAAVVMAAALSATPRLGTALDLLVKPALGLLLYGALVYALDLGGARPLVSAALARLASMRASPLTRSQSA